MTVFDVGGHWLTRPPTLWLGETLLAGARQLVAGEYDDVDEELEELDECHEGETEPQTEHTTQVGDELKQLKTHITLSMRCLSSVSVRPSVTFPYCFTVNFLRMFWPSKKPECLRSCEFLICYNKNNTNSSQRNI